MMWTMPLTKNVFYESIKSPPTLILRLSDVRFIWKDKLMEDDEVRKQQQTLYFEEDLLKEIKKEARRAGSSISWIVQRCCRAGMAEIKALPDNALELELELEEKERRKQKG